MDQHAAFLNEFPLGSGAYLDAIEWFKTLPVYLDLDDIGIVHTCWCSDSLEYIGTITDDDNILNDRAYIEYGDKTTQTYHALERLLKGPEHTLP